MTAFIKEQLKYKVDNLLETYSGLKKLQKLSAANLSQNIENLWAVSYGLVVAIEVTLDIGQYILASKNIKSESYAQIIPKMAEHKILPKKFADKIAKMVNFRNRAIHNYPALDESVVFDILQNDIDDFKKFLRYIKKYLD